MKTIKVGKLELSAFGMAYTKVPLQGMRPQHAALARGLGVKLSNAARGLEGDANVALELSDDEFKLLSLKFGNLELGTVEWTESNLVAVELAQTALANASAQTAVDPLPVSSNGARPESATLTA